MCKDENGSGFTQRVLVVDDEPTIVETLALLLGQRWLVSTAESAVEARQVLAEHEVAAIIADDRMPGESGTELLAWAWRTQPATIRILLTGYTSADKVIEAVNTGRIWHYVRKPWDDQELLNLIERGLELRSRQQALKRKEQIYRELFHNAHVGIMRLDMAGRILEANPAFGGCLGYATEDLIDKRLGALLEDDSEDAWRRLRTRLLEERALSNAEIVLRDQVGRPVHLLLNASLRISSGSEQVIEATTLDLTAQRRAVQESDELRRQLQRTRQPEALSSFASGIVHDFNNELTIITSTTSWVAELVDSDVAECLKDIHGAAMNAAQLARQLLSITRDGGTDYVAVEINPIAGRVLRLLSRAFMQRKLQLRLEAAELLPLVLANASQLHHCLLNLCLNGCEALEDGGQLTVTTAVADGAELAGGKTAGWVKVEVRDTGCGIPEDAQAKIFEPFFTTKTGDEGGGGTGLGLTMVRAIVDQHGGRITVESTPGGGSCFTLLLPSAEHEAAADSEAPPQPGTGTIVVVDDEPAIRKHVTAALRGLGYEVHAAGTGKEALQLVADNRHLDLLVLNIVLPVMSGEEVFLRIRQERPELPVILCTGHLTSADLRKAVDERRVSLLNKPFSIAELSAAIRRALA